MALQIGRDADGAPRLEDDDALLARSLYTTWAVRTGRMPRAVPVTELTPEELIDFWADDQLAFPASRPQLNSTNTGPSFSAGGR